MSCKFKIVENLFRETQPELADFLNEKGLQVWSLIKNSKLFKAKDGKYSLSPVTTAKRQKQIEFIDSLEDFVYLDKEDVVVDLLKILPQSENEDSINSMPPSEVVYQLPQGREVEEFVASEKTIRDLAARMSDRIGIPVKYEADRSKEYKGKLEYGTAVINLAYATLDTAVHEVLAHPIIRAIKNKNRIKQDEYSIKSFTYKGDNYKTEKDIFGYSYKNDEIIDDKEFDKITKEYLKEGELKSSQLYQNLLKELEYGKGKEVLDRVKRDYQFKESLKQITLEDDIFGVQEYVYKIDGKTFNNEQDAKKYQKENPNKTEYSLEEQQEEAIVELLGLMTAEKLDKVKDGKLISLLKRLLKEMKQFVRSLINQKEVEIDKLPDNMTLGDIANILAYSNSKLILPGNEVIYTTPDDKSFKTYQEASNHISVLAKNTKDVDLNNVDINKEIPNKFSYKFSGTNDFLQIEKRDNKWYSAFDASFNRDNKDRVLNWKEIDYKEAKKYYNELFSYEQENRNTISDFIEKNKEYEQSKEIIEEWKKVNNIQYNPEEIYSRGQEFVSVLGAYSSFDVNLMMQNLLAHIEDNEKAGGKFAISAFTKPIDRQIVHLEGGGGKIKFKIFPKSEDILWASNIDVYSGSVWDASEKVNKDKKSELLGVSYSKYPALYNVNNIQPNLADIIDKLSHPHNELGIVLTGGNFRLEYDSDIPYQTKKIIDGINKVLDQRYGKITKPEIKLKSSFIYVVYDDVTKEPIEEFDNEQDAVNYVADNKDDYYKSFDGGKLRVGSIKKTGGIKPTQTDETLKESIESIQNKINNPQDNFKADFLKEGDNYYRLDEEYSDEEDEFSTSDPQTIIKKVPITKEEYESYKPKEKNYTSQALVNTKIAALKEVAKKYPRILIRSEVKSITSNNLFDSEEIPFQKITPKVYSASGEEVVEIKAAIENNLPPEIANSITILQDVPLDILGRNDLFLSMKDILEEKGITNPFLINWFGITLSSNLSRGQAIKNINSESEIEKLANASYNKLLELEDPILKNKDIKESFDKWVNVLENYPVVFKDLMLKHAIKHLRNPERRSKFVLQLSTVALQQTYGIAVNKPHELNRIGKLYDQEVLKTVSDAVGHEPSASGKGYWVHIPKTMSGKLNDWRITKGPGGKDMEWAVEYLFDEEGGLEFFDTEQEARDFVNKRIPIDTSAQFKVNVELLKKLSPSTWCTASGMASHYVENYDNYLLIVDGVTVAGIEAGNIGDNGKVQVKEVTSRGNNGTSSIDHYDDILAFFEKHNLDTNNTSLLRAKNAKDLGKNDAQVAFVNSLEDEYIDNVINTTTVEAALNLPVLAHGYFQLLPDFLKEDIRVATKGIEDDPGNIAYINSELPFYLDLAKKTVTDYYFVYDYLSQEAKENAGIKKIYEDKVADGFKKAEEERVRIANLTPEQLRAEGRYNDDTLYEDLPFSKTNTSQIQGYYDAKNDKVVVIASNTTVKEAPRVAIHEVAHRGMLRMAKELGGDRELFQVLKNSEKQLIQKLPELLKRTGHKSLDNLMLDYGFDKNSEEGKFKLLQELAARWAETLVDKPKPTWWKELLQKIGTWINKFTSKILNENEVNELVGGFVKYGTQDIQTPTVYGANNEPSTLYPKIVDYIKENGFNPNEPYYKDYLEAGYIKDYTPEELAIVHYNLAYPNENIEPAQLFETLTSPEKLVLENFEIDPNTISTAEAKLIVYNPNEAIRQTMTYYKTMRGNNTENFYVQVRDKQDKLYKDYGCM